MKIRIKGNSIRLRLTKSEVEAFGKSGYIEERTEFGNHLFMYALRKNPDVHELSAGFVGIKITMHVPTWMADEWTTTNEVGYSNVYTYDNGKQISLLLEKDFVCLDAAVTEDQSDNYQNPLHTCGPVPQVAEAQAEPRVEEVHEEAVPAAEHFELVEESLPANAGAEAFTPVALEEDFDEESEGAQCSVDELLVDREPAAHAVSDEEPAVDEQYPAVEMPAHEAVEEALMVADEPPVVEQPHAAEELPAHGAVSEALMVDEDPPAVPETAEPTETQEAKEPYWKDYWAPATAVAEAGTQPINDTEPIAKNENVEEQHPWLEPDQDESPAAPAETPSPSSNKGPILPPNWRMKGEVK